jgi:hypothetical protein
MYRKNMIRRQNLGDLMLSYSLLSKNPTPPAFNLLIKLSYHFPTILIGTTTSGVTVLELPIKLEI